MNTFELACKYFHLARENDLDALQQLELKNLRYALWMALGVL